jgi:O-antigen/teichoic acid export membrane protein
MRLAKTSILYFIADVGTSIIGFLATLYFARVLGAGPLGQYFLVVALLGWLSIPSSGIASAVNKRVSEGQSDRSVLSAGMLLSLGYAVLVVAVAVVGGRYINAYVGTEISLFVAGLFVAKVLFETTFEGLKGQKKVAKAGFLRTGDRLLRAAGQIALIHLGYTVVGLVSGHALALFVAAAFGLVIYGGRPTLPDQQTVRNVVDYGRYSWLGDMKTQAISWMDILVLGFFVTSNLVGIYEVSWRLASVLILVSNAVEHTLFPEISDIATDSDYDEVRELLSEALFYAGLFTIPGFFGTIVLGPELLRIYGAEFVRGAPVLLALILARTINVYEMQLLSVINAIDRPDIAFRINFVFVVLNMTLNAILVYMYGWYGAAVATILSSLAILMLSYRAVVQLIGRPDIPLAGISQELLSAAVMAVTIVIVDRVFPVQNMYLTVSLVGFGAAVYGLVLYTISSRIRLKVHTLITS